MLRLACRAVVLAAMPFALSTGAVTGSEPSPGLHGRVRAVKVVVLSTMLADSGIVRTTL